MENKKFFSTHLSKKMSLASVTVLTVFASYGALNAHATPEGANVVSTTNTQSDPTAGKTASNVVISKNTAKGLKDDKQQSTAGQNMPLGYFAQKGMTKIVTPQGIQNLETTGSATVKKTVLKNTDKANAVAGNDASSTTDTGKSVSNQNSTIQNLIKKGNEILSNAVETKAHADDYSETPFFIGSNSGNGETAIDVASYQSWMGQSDYNALKATGIKTIVVKLTEGINYTNPYAASQIAMARAAGLQVAAYHFADYNSSEGNDTPAAEATYFANRAKALGLPAGTPMIQDNEATGTDMISSWSTATTQFNNQLKALGYTNGKVYTAASWFTSGTIQSSSMPNGGNDFWIAQYFYGLPNAHKGEWGSLGAWQDSSVGVISSNQTGYLDTSVDYKGLFNPVQSNTNNSNSTPSNNGYTSITGTENVSIDQTKGTATVSGTLATTKDLATLKVAYYVKRGNTNLADAKWYTATVTGNQYRVTIPMNVFSSGWGAGAYKASDIGHFDVYAYHTSNNSAQGISGSTFTFPAMPLSAISTNTAQKANGNTLDEVNNSFTVTTTTLPTNVASVTMPVWADSFGGQDDLTWSTPTKNSNGQYTLNVAQSAHSYQEGHYTAQVYVKNQMGEVNAVTASNNPTYEGIQTKDQTLAYGAAWNANNGIQAAFDFNGKAIPTSSIKNNAPANITTQSGTHKITYSYTDSRGKTVNAISTVNVATNKASFTTNTFFTWANGGMWTSDILKAATDVNGNKLAVPATGNGVPTNVTATVKNSMGQSFTWGAFSKGAPAGTYTVTFGLNGKTANATVVLFNKVGSGANFKAAYVHDNNVTSNAYGLEMIQNNWYLFDKSTGMTKLGVQDLTAYGQAKSVFLNRSTGMLQYGVITDGSTHYFAQAGSGALQTGWLSSRTTGLGYNVYATTWGTNEYKFETGTQSIGGHTYVFLASGQCWQLLN